MSFPDFPKLDGRVVILGESPPAVYDTSRYQYATSSYKDPDSQAEVVTPGLIAYAASDSDVKKVIVYAKEKGRAVSVRTGGHQYSAASTTSPNNIQLDLSSTYTDVKWENSDFSIVTIGVSFALGDFNKTIREKGRFIPHGQCQFVNLGGHVQTGGYGQLGRSFGLLADRVQRFRIILADGQDSEVTQQSDPDLFFAVLGGSPGNFGVITHVTIHLYKDEDYPDSRGFRAACPFHKGVLKQLLDIMVDEMIADEDYPADYDYCISASTQSQNAFEQQDSGSTYDAQHIDTSETLYKIVPGSITIFVQWANLEGRKQNYEKDGIVNGVRLVDKIKEVLKVFPPQYVKIMVDDTQHYPLSILTSHWIIPIRREFALAYKKRCYASNYTADELRRVDLDLPEDDSGDNKWTWAKLVAGLLDDTNWQYIATSSQFQHFGGAKSKLKLNGRDNTTSYSWRDTRIVSTMDAWYYLDQEDKSIGEASWFAELVSLMVPSWIKDPHPPFCNEDRRLLWGSQDLNLPRNRKYYFDDIPKGKYQKLCDIKLRVDPTDVFTPNEFSVGPERERGGDGVVGPGPDIPRKSPELINKRSKFLHAIDDQPQKDPATMPVREEFRTDPRNLTGPRPMWEQWRV